MLWQGKRRAGGHGEARLMAISHSPDLGRSLRVIHLVTRSMGHLRRSWRRHVYQGRRGPDSCDVFRWLIVFANSLAQRTVRTKTSHLCWMAMCAGDGQSTPAVLKVGKTISLLDSVHNASKCDYVSCIAVPVTIRSPRAAVRPCLDCICTTCSNCHMPD